MKSTIPTNQTDPFAILQSKNLYPLTSKSINPNNTKTFNFATTQPLNAILSSKNLYAPVKTTNEPMKTNQILQKTDNNPVKMIKQPTEKSLKESSTLSFNILGNINSPKFTQKINLSNIDKRASAERVVPKNVNHIDYTQSLNNINKQYQISKTNEPMVLKETNRQEYNVNNRFKKLEINTDPMASSFTSFKYPISCKIAPSSAKNKESDKGQENSIVINGSQTYSQFDLKSKFTSKYINTMSTNSTECTFYNNNNQGIPSLETITDDYKTQQNQENFGKKIPFGLNKFFNEKEQVKENENNSQNTPYHFIRVNNFITHSQINGVSSGLIESRANQIHGQDQITPNINEVPRESKRIMHRAQSEHKHNLKNSAIEIQPYNPQSSMNNSSITTDSNNLRSTQLFAPRYNNNFESLRNSSYGQLTQTPKNVYNNISNNNAVNTQNFIISNNNQASQISTYQAPLIIQSTESDSMNGNFSQTQNTFYQTSHISQQQQQPINYLQNTIKSQGGAQGDTQAVSNQKSLLNNFVTKVNKGEIFTRPPQEGTQTGSSNLDSFNINNTSNVAPSIKPLTSNAFITSKNISQIQTSTQNENDEATNIKSPFLFLDEKLISKTPKQSNNNPISNISKTMPKTTTNVNAQTFTFGTESQKIQTQVPSSMFQQTTSSPRDSSAMKLKLSKTSTASCRSVSSGPSAADEPTPKLIAKYPTIYYMPSLEKYHLNPSEKDYFSKVYKDHFLQTYQALKFCKILKPVDPKVITQKKVFLNKRETHKDKKTIVFDLDETLIHCNESVDIPHDVKLPIKFPSGDTIQAGINIRPYAIECLKELSQDFEIIIFTASHGCYANVVLDYLDPTGQYIHHRLFRESCVQTEEGLYIKDLRILGNRNLGEVVLVDNAAYSFGFQIENGIPIIPFYDNKNDEELKALVSYLRYLNNFKDLRDANKSTFKLYMYSMFDSPEKVLDKVIYTRS